MDHLHKRLLRVTSPIGGFPGDFFNERSSHVRKNKTAVDFFVRNVPSLRRMFLSKFAFSPFEFADNNKDLLEKYQCPKCHYILRDAVQTSCGHWLCQGCAEEMFDKK